MVKNYQEKGKKLLKIVKNKLKKSKIVKNGLKLPKIIKKCPGNTGIARVLPRYFPQNFGDFGNPGISKLATGHPVSCVFSSVHW